MSLNKRIVCVGPMWKGSNAGGLFRALARKGCEVSIIDEFYFIPMLNQKIKTRLLSKVFRGWFVKEYNTAILNETNRNNPDVVLVYKGAFVLPETLHAIRRKGVLLVNFYPDVSFHTHGKYLLKTLPLFDHIFTTKTFGIHDLKEQLGLINVSFVPHGFDPEVHRKTNVSKRNEKFSCEVSFIGTWSAKKESLISYLIKSMPDVRTKIWGNQWERATDKILLASGAIQGHPVSGDAYSLAVNNSLINLGLLSEQVQGASSGDKITSRTFHIPGAGGFLLHERTSEVQEYFTEGLEMACFSGEDELVEKIKFYLKHDKEREMIRDKGHKRAIKDHSLDSRVISILNSLDEIL